MKFVHIQEAGYAGGQERESGYYAVDDSMSNKITLVGPFAVADDVNKYIEYLTKKYGNDVPIVLEKGNVMSPREYEKDIAGLHGWLFNDED